MNVQCTRLCPKDICKSAVLPKEESTEKKSGLNSEKDFVISENCHDTWRAGSTIGFSIIAYPNTLLDLDSSFSNTEFAEKYCSIVNTFV